MGPQCLGWQMPALLVRWLLGHTKVAMQKPLSASSPSLLLITKVSLGTVPDTYNPGTWEAEAGGLS